MHLLLGVILSITIFVTGSGLILLASRQAPPLGDLLLRAFLPGAVLLGTAAVASVLMPFGGPIAVAAICASMVPLARYRWDRTALAPVQTAVAVVLPPSTVIASIMGFLFHGPTSTLSATPYGDSSLYIHRAIAIFFGLTPLHNLGVEGATWGLGNLLTSFLMSPLLRWEWFDPFLFISTSLVVLSVLCFGLMLSLLVHAWGAGSAAVRGPARWIVIGLLAGALRYPSWIVESPPLSFAFPIIVSTVYLWRKDSNKPGMRWQSLATGIVGSAVSKVVMFAVLAPLVATEIPRTLMRIRNWRALIIGAIAAVLFGIYVALMLTRYLPEYLPLLDIRAHSSPLMLARAIGAMLLAVAASRMRVPGLTLAVACGVACYLILPMLFHATLTAVMILLALVVLERPERLAWMRLLLIVAILLLLPAPCFFEPGPHPIVIGWMLTLWFVASSAITAGCREPVSYEISYRTASTGLLFILAIILGAVGTGVLPARAVPVTARPIDIVTPEIRDMWLAVRDHTPPDSLIFTDQTGPNSDHLSGWGDYANDYATISGRQFFLLSWAEYIPLRNDPSGRAEWLQRNAEVLSGALRADQLHLSRRYAAYFAVMSSDRKPPPGAIPVYANTGYRLYRLAE